MKKKLLILFALLAWLFTVSIALRNVLSGSIPFWYDPARDMLSAWGNLHKLTLIGPTSGIPGIFYGPYWIWWLSFGELFSKDPKIVDLIVQTVPYLIFFPLMLYFFSKVFGKLTVILLWLLFFYSSQTYMIFLWNPHLAPLLFLVVIYLLATINYKNLSKSILGHIFLAGIFTGLALNIHISLGVGFTFGSLFFLFLVSFLYPQIGFSRKSVLRGFSYFGSFLLGILLMFVPFFLFEVRHGFHQTRTAINAFLHAGGVVSLQGLSKQEIVSSYLLKFAAVLQMPNSIGILLFVGSIVLLIGLLYKRKIHLSRTEVQLLGILGSITFAVLTVYLMAKNPIWGYHFIGVEIVMLLYIGLVISKIKPLQYILLIWVLFLTVQQGQNFVHAFSANRFVTSSLYTEDYIVHTIQTDAKGKTYTVYVYSPSIYSYEFSYLFKEIASKDVPYDPGSIQREGIIYLVLPKAKKSTLTDFIAYRTPNALYKTTGEWHIPDGTIILRRELIK